MRESDRELVKYLDQLKKSGQSIIEAKSKAEKKELLEAYIREIKTLMEWPHQKQLNPLITMRIKDFRLEALIAYMNDTPITIRRFFIFDKPAQNQDIELNKQVKRINLALEAIRYFYKSR